MREGIQATERRTLEKVHLVEAEIEGPNALFACPECEQELRTGAGQVGGEVVSIKCPHCGFRDSVRMYEDLDEAPDDPAAAVPDPDTFEITTYEIEGPNVEFACPGCEGELRTAAGAVAQDGPVQIRCPHCGGADYRVLFVED